jgi:sorbitol-specific phosphotransferase system component IIBC
MARARIVSQPPQDYIPEPLVSPPLPPEIVEEQQWIDGNLEEEITIVETNEPSQEELEKERIAQEKYEELQRKKAEEESRLNRVTIFTGRK